jgi:hypothetical protein
MNIFAVHPSPYTAAEMLCDVHIHKMTLESAQLLSGVYDPLLVEGLGIYKRTHYHGRYARWVRKTDSNFEWLFLHGMTLADQYRIRFGKTHKSEEVLERCWRYRDILDLPRQPLTKFPVPDGYDPEKPVLSIRQYYVDTKEDIARWKRGVGAPKWWGDPFIKKGADAMEVYIKVMSNDMVGVGIQK